MPSKHIGIIAHGGAGSYKYTTRYEVNARRKVLAESVNQGYSVLKNGGSALDAVESTINLMEDSKIFNCGKGSCLAADGSLRMDAAVMKGDLECGAVGDSTITPFPVSLARQVMEKSDHVLLVGSKLADFCKIIGFKIEEVHPTRARLEQFEKYRSDSSGQRKNRLLLGQYEKIGCSDTVGAVAIDQDSRLCTGVSTGGIWMKLPGRVGDSPIVGAGLYADDSAGAVCATGIGEEIIRVCLSKTACDLMKSGVDAQTACDESIRMITRLRGSDNGGLIALDKKGRIGISWNTEVLSTAFKFDRMKRTEVSVLPKRRKL